MSIPTVTELKAQAKAVRSVCAAQGVKMTHSAALEAMAKQYGFVDWNAAVARQCSPDTVRSPSSDAHGDLILGMSPIQICMIIRPDGLTKVEAGDQEKFWRLFIQNPLPEKDGLTIHHTRHVDPTIEWITITRYDQKLQAVLVPSGEIGLFATSETFRDYITGVYQFLYMKRGRHTYSIGISKAHQFALRMNRSDSAYMAAVAYDIVPWNPSASKLDDQERFVRCGLAKIEDHMSHGTIVSLTDLGINVLCVMISNGYLVHSPSGPIVPSDPWTGPTESLLIR